MVRRICDKHARMSQTKPHAEIVAFYKSAGENIRAPTRFIR
jgi:hypothetical protein